MSLHASDSRPARRGRMALESLEPRRLLTQFAVDTLVDESDGDFSAGDLSLREAIEQANANPGEDTIVFDEALNGGTIVLSSGALELTDVSRTTINGSGSANLSLSGNNLTRVFAIADGATATITGLTITEGNASPIGGGILNQGDLTLEDAAIVANAAVSSGGGIANSGGVLSLSGTRLEQNISGADGAGLSNFDDGVVTLDDVTLSGNSSATRGGGLLNNSPLGTVVVRNATIEGNTTGTFGAGVFNLGTLTMNDSTLTGNIILNPNGDGGGIFNQGSLEVVGSTIGNNEAGRYGGGLLTQYGETSVSDSTIAGNISGSYGGGINVIGGTLNIASMIIEGNSSGDFGGGIANSGTVAIVGSTIRDNLADFEGGGLFNLDGDVTLEDSIVSGNSVEVSGGGILNILGTLTVVGSSITGNTTSLGLGGGINNIDARLELTDSTISENTAGYGGGLYNGIYAEASISNSTISGNSAIDGGGVFNGYDGSTTLINSTVSGNSAAGNGGGIYHFDNTLAINHSTIIDNQADSDGDGVGTGGGIWTYNDSFTFTELSNSIVSANRSGLGNVANNVANKAPEPSSVGNLVGTGGVGVDPLTNLNGVDDPQLSPLQDNGGPTFTHVPLADSPVIDAADLGSSTLIDQRGVERPVDGSGDGIALPDIGAVEYAPLLDGPVSVGPNGDVLVEGTDQADLITIVSSSPSEIQITLNGEEFGPFDLSDGSLLEVRAGDGDDTVDGSTLIRVDLLVEAGAGDDVVTSGTGRDNLFGGPGNDSMIGSGRADLLDGGEGDDTLRGAGNNDILLGGPGDDDLDGNNLDDLVVGGEGNDLIAGGRRDDELIGGLGEDTLIGRGGEDFLDGGIGDDQLFGGGGEDTLLGDSGNDTLIGQNGADTIRGDAGNDSLDGGPGGDLLEGGSNRDTLRGGQQTDSIFGGAGVDLFVVGAVPGSGPFSDEHELRMVNGFLQHRQFRDGTLIEQDRIFSFDALADAVLLEALGGDDTIRVASDVMIGGTLDGGEGFDLAILDPTIRANWILASIEDESDS